MLYCEYTILHTPEGDIIASSIYYMIIYRRSYHTLIGKPMNGSYVHRKPCMSLVYYFVWASFYPQVSLLHYVHTQ